MRTRVIVERPMNARHHYHSGSFSGTLYRLPAHFDAPCSFFVPWLQIGALEKPTLSALASS
jgi:hypothetical protein